jgi:hypothetical protein
VTRDHGTVTFRTELECGRTYLVGLGGPGPVTVFESDSDVISSHCLRYTSKTVTVGLDCAASDESIRDIGLGLSLILIIEGNLNMGALFKFVTLCTCDGPPGPVLEGSSS